MQRIPFPHIFPKAFQPESWRVNGEKTKSSRGDRPRGTYATMRDLVPNQIGGERSKVNYLCKHPAKH